MFVRALIDPTRSLSMFKKIDKKKFNILLKKASFKRLFFVLKKTKKFSQQRERELLNGTVQSYIYITLETWGRRSCQNPQESL